MSTPDSQQLPQLLQPVAPLQLHKNTTTVDSTKPVLAIFCLIFSHPFNLYTYIIRSQHWCRRMLFYLVVIQQLPKSLAFDVDSPIFGQADLVPNISYECSAHRKAEIWRCLSRLGFQNCDSGKTYPCTHGCELPYLPCRRELGFH